MIDMIPYDTTTKLSEWRHLSAMASQIIGNSIFVGELVQPNNKEHQSSTLLVIYEGNPSLAGVFVDSDYISWWYPDG